MLQYGQEKAFRGHKRAKTPRIKHYKDLIVRGCIRDEAKEIVLNMVAPSDAPDAEPPDEDLQMETPERAQDPTESSELSGR